jgi:putative SOS response-associated peptidase YedK
MCDHYRLDPRDVQLHKLWNSCPLPIEVPSLARDVRPQQRALVFRGLGSNGVFEMMRWGIPSLARRDQAKAETTPLVTTVRNPSSRDWRNAMAHAEQRCLVPFSQFALPRGCLDPLTGGPGRYWFSIKDEPVAAFAAIWCETEGERAFSILYCDSNALVTPLHPKGMPAILAPEDYSRWLGAPYQEACTMVMPFPSQLMDVI